MRAVLAWAGGGDNPGPAEAPRPDAEIPADVNTGCSFATAAAEVRPEWNEFVRLGPDLCRLPDAGDASLPPARFDRIVRDHLRVLFGGRSPECRAAAEKLGASTDQRRVER